MSAPDFYAMAARKVHGLPDEWQPRIYKALSDGRVTIGYSLIGAVPVGVISRGPRRGKPKWPPRAQLREVIITPADVAAVTAEWVASTGLCSRCGGEGFIAWRASASNGTEYCPCNACGGTEKAPTDETTTTEDQP